MGILIPEGVTKYITPDIRYYQLLIIFVLSDAFVLLDPVFFLCMYFLIFLAMYWVWYVKPYCHSAWSSFLELGQVH